MKLLLRFLLLTSLAAGPFVRAGNGPAPASSWRIGTGADYSRGDYGFATDTEVFSVPVQVTYESGAWLFTTSVPWLNVRGPAVITGAGGAPRPTSASESGLGDVLIGTTYRFGEVIGSVSLAFTGRVKLPTADEARGLGTGETDFYGQFDFYRTVGNATPFASVGYRALGDSTLYRLEDGLYVSAGSHFRASDRTVWTIAANWGRRILAGGDPTADVMLAFNHDWDASWRFTAYGLKGFTDASPDYGAGVALSRQF